MEPRPAYSMDFIDKPARHNLRNRAYSHNHNFRDKFLRPVQWRRGCTKLWKSLLCLFWRYVLGMLSPSVKRLQNGMHIVNHGRTQLHSSFLVRAVRPEPVSCPRNLCKVIQYLSSMNFANGLRILRAISFWQYQIHQEQWARNLSPRYLVSTFYQGISTSCDEESTWAKCAAAETNRERSKRRCYEFPIALAHRSSYMLANSEIRILRTKMTGIACWFFLLADLRPSHLQDLRKI